MAKEILKDEIMDDEELDGVAGGTRIETYQDGDELVKRGLLSVEDALSSSKVREAIHKLGYKYVDHGGVKMFGGKDNEYFNKVGESVNRETFWKNFDKENITNISTK